MAQAQVGIQSDFERIYGIDSSPAPEGKHARLPLPELQVPTLTPWDLGWHGLPEPTSYFEKTLGYKPIPPPSDKLRFPPLPFTSEKHPSGTVLQKAHPSSSSMPMDERSFHEALQSIKAEIRQMNAHYHRVLSGAQQQQEQRAAFANATTQPLINPHEQVDQRRDLQSFRLDIRGLDARLELMESRLDHLDDRLSSLEPGTPPETPVSQAAQLVDLVLPEVATSMTPWAPLVTSSQTSQPSHATAPEIPTLCLPIAQAQDVGFFDPYLADVAMLIPYSESHLWYSDVTLFIRKLKRVSRTHRILDVEQCLRGEALRWWQDGVGPNGIHELDDKPLEVWYEVLMRQFGNHTAMDSLLLFVNDQFIPQDAAVGRQVIEDYGRHILRLIRHVQISDEEQDNIAKTFIHSGLDPLIQANSKHPNEFKTAVDYLTYLKGYYQTRVYTLLQQIPEGKIASYASLARALGSSPRAVGGALRRNPFAPSVPCHRVIAASGFVGGFQGDWQRAPSGVNCEKKLGLLKEEGVVFDTKGMLVDRAQWWDGFVT
ncbi:hypothetical protein B0A49_03645 [Cryomyces minteri]|uniref:Methylated-DNA--protein-cysteine methyltransferase n=1 Tax=Cryomyces minteri TaxID=331657 RepID=A0A4U0XRQ7_9PEZI|nr:hypothetical protein B0A49_03645 [Cryomyces minteri]